MLLAIEAGERFSFCLCVAYTFSPISTISIQIVEREKLSRKSSFMAQPSAVSFVTKWLSIIRKVNLNTHT